jgi:hypothetical protein
MTLPIKLLPGVALQEFTATDRLDARVYGLFAVREVLGTTYTLQASDHGAYLRFTDAGLIDITAPDDTGAAIPVGTVITIVQEDGDISITAGGTATVDAFNGQLHLAGQYSVGELLKIGANRWLFTTYAIGS